MENPQVEIAVLQTKVDSLIEKQKELTQRVRANEKVVAAVTLLGTVVLAVIGAGYFAPEAEAHPGHPFPTGEWIQRVRDYESEKTRTPIDEMLNSAIEDLEIDYGSDDPTEQEVLLQLPSSENRQSSRWGHDRCNNRSWFRFIQKRTCESRRG
tara:strand:+ start:71 stop:529 length:459 start_codon:yes stop_codon:yes gene_type:complete